MFVPTESDGAPRLRVDEAQEWIRIVAGRYGIREQNLVAAVGAGHAWAHAKPADYYYVRNTVWALEDKG